MDLTIYNSVQKKAILNKDGPCLIIAGAGSGKTSVLTSRVNFLIECGVSCDSILCVTFTNKAANEMRERLLYTLGTSVYDIKISTFHSFGLFLIKKHFDLLGYSTNFTILDNNDSLNLVKIIIKELDLSFDHYNPYIIKDIISNSKNNFINSLEYEKFVTNDYEKNVFMIFKLYEIKLKKNNCVDFEDLLYLPVTLFKCHKDILEIYQDLYKYILIDEYQDINNVQYMLVKMLSDKNKNICVVGDESQSIYSFRGANFNNILNFENDYNNCSTFYLEQNYRSTCTILNAANSLIKNNKYKKDKNLWTRNEIGEKIYYYNANNDVDEADYVCTEIKKLIDSGVSSNEICILYRTNIMSQIVEKKIIQYSIPYKIFGNINYYDRKEIKDLIAYLRLVYNTNDDVSLLRIINVPKRGIGKKTISDLTKYARENNLSLFDAISSGKPLLFKEMIYKIKTKVDKISLCELIDYILNITSLKKELIDINNIDDQLKSDFFEDFKLTIKDKDITLGDFIADICLTNDISNNSTNNVVSLMTIHSAKGLEFDYVFLIGMEEGIFPHINSYNDSYLLEEERRLCYVAITRSKKRLWLTNAKRRFSHGVYHSNKISRFIDEMDSEYLCFVNDNKIIPKIEPDNKIVDDNFQYKIGEHVIHSLYKEGIIVNNDNDYVVVAFEFPFGVKKMLKTDQKLLKKN